MFDALTAAALADQLSHEIENGRIQNVGLISRQAVWFEIFANRRRVHFTASAENQASAVYLTDQEPVWDRQLVTPLLLLLRKYARGGRVVSIQQPPLERVITLSIARPRVHDPALGPATTEAISPDFEPGDEQDPEGSDEDEEDDRFFTHLHCEVMGRHSNLVLVDDQGSIMESAKRVSVAMSRVRPIAPHRQFIPPPARAGKDPRIATEAELRPVIDRANDARALVKSLPAEFRGMSPLVAAEAVHRSLENPGQLPAASSLARSIRNLFEPMLTGAWQPTIYRDGEGDVVEYAALPMGHLSATLQPEPVKDIARAISLAEGAGESTGPRHSIRAKRLETAIGAAIDRLRGKMDALDTEETRHQDRERYRSWGELIYGYAWQLKPGDRELVVGDERIPLDPAIDPREQARIYLQQYRDGKNADQHIESVRAETGLDLQYLNQLRTMAGQAVSIQDIEDIEAEWNARQPAVRNRPLKRSSGRKRTTPVLEVKGNPIYVGRSGSENDRVTFEIAGPDDTWLHARGVPGSHVIVRWLGADRDDDAVLLRAAELAAWFSQSRESGRVEVDITARRYVRKVKGSGPGMVTYRNERTVSVAPVGPD